MTAQPEMTLLAPSEGAVLLRVGRKFRLRRTEWLAAVQLTICGFVLLMPGTIFDATPTYDVVRAIPEWVWGAAAMVIGAVRLIGLVVNGLRNRITSQMRLAGALAGAGFFTLLSLSLLGSGVLGLWLAAWPTIAVIEYFNIWDTTRDAQSADG